VTNTSQRRSLWLAVVTVPVLFAALFILQTRIDARTRSETQQQQELLLRSPAAIEKMSLGYNSLLADVYWTRAVQYYGGQLVARDYHFPLLWPLLDISTTLDPKLLPAYHFGAMFLSERYLGADRPDLAVKLVKRGIAANPERWGLYSDLGFLYYWYLRDYHDAAQAYLDGCNKAQGPSWMKILAARLDQKGGSLETSRMIWTQVYETNSDPKIRKLALETLKGLKAQQDEQELDTAVGEYRQRFGRYPASFAEMRNSGMLRGIPVDPDGYPYVLGPDGKSALNPRSDVTIPTEPRTPPRSATK
jgi:tetratricopeptide (TPR) repeat protein